MNIKIFNIHHYQIPLTNGQTRFGAFIQIVDEKGNSGWGEIAPLPKWSRETLEESLEQLHQRQGEISKIDWTARNCLQELAKLELLPAVLFGLESALLSRLNPLTVSQVGSVAVSALLMGSPEEILKQATLRRSEGYTSAKLKVGNLTFEEAAQVISQLKDQFRLRLDVNRAWNTSDSLRFFSQFPLDIFDYVEEPFQNPHDLARFPHPLAVDESFPQDLSLEQLESLPTLKALIYKPTIQGGMLGCLPLYEWTRKRGIALVLSSVFESDLGLAHIASIARRLSLTAPIGIGTYHHMKAHLFKRASCKTQLLSILENVMLAPALVYAYSLGNQKGPTLLFLHGFLGNKEEFSDIATHFEADYRILAIDLPGHGGSLFEESAFFEMEICAANIITLLQNLGLQWTYLVGYSMGGRLALYLAVNYPQFFKKVLLISASPGIEDLQEKERRIKADFVLARNLENQDFSLFLEKWYDLELFSSLKSQPGLLKRILCKRRKNSPKHLAMSLDYMGTGRQQSLWQDLSLLQTPLDLVVGSDDAKFVSIGEKMSLCNPANIRLHKVEGAGHAVHLENESSFCAILKNWLF